MHTRGGAQTRTHVGIYNEKSAYRCAPQGFIDLNIFCGLGVLGRVLRRMINEAW